MVSVWGCWSCPVAHWQWYRQTRGGSSGHQAPVFRTRSVVRDGVLLLALTWSSYQGQASSASADVHVKHLGKNHHTGALTCPECKNRTREVVWTSWKQEAMNLCERASKGPRAQPEHTEVISLGYAHDQHQIWHHRVQLCQWTSLFSVIA